MGINSFYKNNFFAVGFLAFLFLNATLFYQDLEPGYNIDPDITPYSIWLGYPFGYVVMIFPGYDNPSLAAILGPMIFNFVIWFIVSSIIIKLYLIFK